MRSKFERKVVQSVFKNLHDLHEWHCHQIWNKLVWWSIYFILFITPLLLKKNWLLCINPKFKLTLPLYMEVTLWAEDKIGQTKALQLQHSSFTDHCWSIFFCAANSSKLSLLDANIFQKMFLMNIKIMPWHQTYCTLSPKLTNRPNYPWSPEVPDPYRKKNAHLNSFYLWMWIGKVHCR